jgi:hypothetical protein
MAEEPAAPRSRRALLTAAAGAAGALAASAVLPLTAAAADPNDVVMGVDNPTTATTSITNSTTGSTAFAADATGVANDVDFGYGVRGTSLTGAGVAGWSVSAPGGGFTPAITAYTGVFGWSPADPVTAFATGVYGASDDVGVLGVGNAGVYGYGTNGVIGESASTSAGVLALGQSATDLALDVRGKVKFSRSSRSTIGSGKSTLKVTLAGTTTSSRIFAVLHTNRSNRWVRAVVPASGSFTIYLNGTVSASTYVAWFVLN